MSTFSPDQPIRALYIFPSVQHTTVISHLRSASKTHDNTNSCCNLSSSVPPASKSQQTVEDTSYLLAYFCKYRSVLFHKMQTSQHCRYDILPDKTHHSHRLRERVVTALFCHSHSVIVICSGFLS